MNFPTLQSVRANHSGPSLSGNRTSVAPADHIPTFDDDHVNSYHDHVPIHSGIFRISLHQRVLPKHPASLIRTSRVLCLRQHPYRRCVPSPPHVPTSETPPPPPPQEESPPFLHPRRPETPETATGGPKVKEHMSEAELCVVMGWDKTSYTEQKVCFS